jgi:hypothetical protein
MVFNKLFISSTDISVAIAISFKAVTQSSPPSFSKTSSLIPRVSREVYKLSIPSVTISCQS